MVMREEMKLKSDIRIHGFLLWASMGFFMPLGILAIRFSSHHQAGLKPQLLFHLHLIFQILSLVGATTGAILSLKNFENSFNNHHQITGLVLYAGIWVQAITGLLKPKRGDDKRRRGWFFVHWMFGTIISLMGIVNIYTGLTIYKTRKLFTASTIGFYIILFTAQVGLMGFLYLLPDKLDYMKKQRVVSVGGREEAKGSSSPVVVSTSDRKVFLPQPCGKTNALVNLFD